MDIDHRFRISYDPEADALVITLHDDKPDHGEEIAPGIILHYNSRDEVIEIEILNASEFVKAILQEYLSNSKKLSNTITEVAKNYVKKLKEIPEERQ